MAHEVDPEPTEGFEQPAPRHVLDDPEVQRKIAESLARIERGETRRGKTAEEIRELLRARRPVGP